MKRQHTWIGAYETNHDLKQPNAAQKDKTKANKQRRSRVQLQPLYAIYASKYRDKS